MGLRGLTGGRTTVRFVVDETSKDRNKVPRKLVTSVRQGKRLVGKDTWIQSSKDVALVSAYPVGTVLEVDVDVTSYDGKQGIENLGNPKVISLPTRETLVKLYSAKAAEYDGKGRVLSGRCVGMCHKVKEHLNPVCTADGEVVGICNSPKCLEAHLTRVLKP